MHPTVKDILEYTRLAPSVHNTQPWRFKIDENSSSLSLFAEPTRALQAGDPTQRELWVSLGICLETILQSAKGLGLNATITQLQTTTPLEQIARITFEPSAKEHPYILELIKNRHSYRGTMENTSLSPSFIEACNHAIQDIENISLILVQEKEKKEYIADITDKGMRMALSSAKFRKELAPLLHYNWSSARTGLHGFTMNYGTLGSIWQKWSVILGLDSKRQAQADKDRLLEASGILFILSRGDVPSFWLNVGRAYMRVALEITKAGFAHSTLTAPVEAARYHEDIENMLGTKNRIQSMIRIGKATQPIGKTAPRLNVDELLT